MKILIALALFAAAVAALEPQAIRLPDAPLPAYETVPDIRPLFISSAILEELATRFADPALRGKVTAGLDQPEPVMLAEAPLPEVEESVQPFEVSNIQVADMSFATEEVSKVQVADLPFATEEVSKVQVADLPFATEEVSKVQVADLSFATEEVSKVQVADLSFATEEVSKVQVAELSFPSEELNKVNIVDMPVVAEETYQFDVVDSFPGELFTPVKVVEFVNEVLSIPVEPVKVASIQVEPVNVASIHVSPVQVASIDSSQFMYADPRLR